MYTLSGRQPLRIYKNQVQRSVAAFRSRGALGALFDPQMRAEVREWPAPIPRSVTGGYPYQSRVQRAVKRFNSRGALPPERSLTVDALTLAGMPDPGDELGEVAIPFPRNTPQFLPYDDGFVKIRSQQGHTRRDHLRVSRPAGFASPEELMDRDDAMTASRMLSGFGDMTPGEAAYVKNSAPKTSPTMVPEEELQEIVVSGRVVPWYVWLAAGAAILFVLKR